MTLQQLKYIVEIEKTRSITWAADNLFISQPNLSRSIRDLERHLGFQIFTRTHRGMVPTSEGSELIERAKRILLQIASIEEITIRKQKKRQHFGISVPHISYIAFALRKFMSELETDCGIDIDYCETDTLTALENLRDARHHLAIVRYQSDSEAEILKYFEDYSLTVSKLRESESLILISNQHPLASFPEIDPKHLLNFIELKHQHFYSHVPSKTAHHPVPAKQVLIHSSDSQFELLTGNSSAYMWSTPLPAETLEREQLVMRRCTVKAEIYTDALLWRSSYTLSSLDERFIQCLKEVHLKL